MKVIRHTNCRVVITGLREGSELTVDQCRDIVGQINRNLKLDVPVYVAFESDAWAVCSECGRELAGILLLKWAKPCCQASLKGGTQ